MRFESYCPRCGRKFMGAASQALCAVCNAKEKSEDAARRERPMSRWRRGLIARSLSGGLAVNGDVVCADSPSRTEWRGQHQSWPAPRPCTEEDAE